MKSHFTKRLQIRGRTVRLADWNSGATPGCKTKAEAADRLAKNLERIDAQQYRLFAEARRSLLIVLQGMDTAGKDGLIRKVMTVFNPQGCRVWPFKVPTSEEAAHDFLWRIHRAAPARGEVSIFNRSHYEDVLVVRVHDIVPRKIWSRRYKQINAFERHLNVHGTKVIKLFLHISRKEQQQRLLARLDDPLKRWKFSEADLAERKHWSEYQRAYEVALARCSTPQSPWHVIPADNKWYRDLAVSEVLAETLEEMDPKLPKAKLDVKGLRESLLAT
ncbi:MAG: polyphosphate kinase 2 family protein [Candidatus Eisenbacteria bacterium]